jgi:hypothetical protein
MTGIHLDEFIQLLEQPEARKIVSGALFDYVGKLAKEAGAAPQNIAVTKIATGRLMFAIKLWESFPEDG